MTAAARTHLKNLDRIEAKAWNVMMNGSEIDARTVRGEEGKNYLDWCAKADACRAYREEIERIELAA